MRTEIRRWLAIVMAPVCLVGAAFDSALAEGLKQGSGSIRLEYQYIETGTFYDDTQEFDYWSTDSQVAILSMDYAISDRLTVFASLPYVRKRFVSEVPWGGDPHNPNDPYWIDFVPPDKRFIDDGEYHGGFQDFSVGVSYLAFEGPLTLSPYIAYGVPTTDYPFFGKAAIGANLWSIPVGVSFSYVPYFSDWHFRGNLAYVFSEKPLDVNVDYWLVHLSAGYWFTGRLAMNAFASLKYVREGFKMPWSFTDDPNYGNYPDEFDTEEWWNHDRLLGHRNLNLGVGADYFLSRRYKVSGTVYTGVWTEQSSEVDYAVTLGLTHFFGASN